MNTVTVLDIEINKFRKACSHSLAQVNVYMALIVSFFISIWIKSMAAKCLWFWWTHLTPRRRQRRLYESTKLAMWTSSASIRVATLGLWPSHCYHYHKIWQHKILNGKILSLPSSLFPLPSSLFPLTFERERDKRMCQVNAGCSLYILLCYLFIKVLKPVWSHL